MTFLIRPGAPLYQAQLQARALDGGATLSSVRAVAVGRLPRGGPCVSPWRVRRLRGRA